MKKLLALALVAPLLTVPAVAADLYIEDVTVPDTFESAAFDWTGFYVGAGAGYVWSNANSEFINPALAARTIDLNPSGFLGEVHAGYNQQLGVVVLGAEAGVGFGDITDTIPDPLIGLPGPAPGDTVTGKSDLNFSVLGKAGVAVDRVLPYLTAGLVGAHISTTATAGGADDDGWFYGLGVGGGVEVALTDQLSVRGQYLYTQLSGPNFNVGQGWETKSSPASSTVTFGANYRF